jgi:hypothetical protein
MAVMAFRTSSIERRVERAHRVSRLRRLASIGTLLVLIAGGWMFMGVKSGLDGLTLASGVAHAEDTRPAEIPYDTPGDFPLLDPGYSSDKHEVVVITDDALQPRSISLEPGQLVAWISYARAASMVVFEREVAKSMICHSLVNFTIQEDELRSAEIQTGEFASFCELKPGRYRYKIVRRNREGASAGETKRRLDGEIIVRSE